jgi:PBP1b-binding outer membrane lipoprotein LpoB
MILRKFLMVMMVLVSLVMAGCARTEAAQVSDAAENQAAEVVVPAVAEPAQTNTEAETAPAIPEPAQNQAADEVAG